MVRVVPKADIHRMWLGLAYGRAPFRGRGAIMLIIFGGLSGTGKTTISQVLARRLSAVHVRVDTIEQVIMDSYGAPVGEAGYRVGYAVAEDNLRLGQIVIADSVNPLNITRDSWRAVADRLRSKSSAPTRTSIVVALSSAKQIFPDRGN